MTLQSLAHDPHARYHQGLDNGLIVSELAMGSPDGQAAHRDRLAGSFDLMSRLPKSLMVFACIVELRYIIGRQRGTCPECLVVGSTRRNRHLLGISHHAAG